MQSKHYKVLHTIIQYKHAQGNQLEDIKLSVLQSCSSVWCYSKDLLWTNSFV